MIEFFVRGFLHLFFNTAVTRDGGVPLVKALGRDLTGVVHAHKARRVPALALVQFIVIHTRRRVRPW